jgi:hypothetical protein
MRATILSLFLYGVTAFCQSNAPALVPAPPLSRDFSKLPPGWHAVPLAIPKIVIVPKAVDRKRLSRTEIDPEIIVRPSPSSIGVQPPGTAVRQNEYPNLRMQPINSTNSAMQTIPTMWPRYRLESIPTQWPMHEMLPVRSWFEGTSRSPGN